MPSASGFRVACAALLLAAVGGCAAQRIPVADSAAAPEARRRTWASLSEEGDDAYREKRLDDAVAAWSEALPLAREELGDESEPVAQLYASLARARFAREEFDLADQSNDEALRLREQLYGPEDPRVGESLVMRGTLSFQRGDLDGAESSFERALRIFDAAGLMNDPLNAGILSNLGRVHYNKGEFEKAEARYRRLLTIYAETLGEEHEKVGQTLNDLGVVYLMTRRPGMAAQVLRPALRILERELGPDDQSVSAVRTNLKVAVQQLKRRQQRQRRPRRPPPSKPL